LAGGRRGGGLGREVRGRRLGTVEQVSGTADDGRVNHPPIGKRMDVRMPAAGVLGSALWLWARTAKEGAGDESCRGALGGGLFLGGRDWCLARSRGDRQGGVREGGGGVPLCVLGWVGLSDRGLGESKPDGRAV